jgi:hypothetical protein
MIPTAIPVFYHVLMPGLLLESGCQERPNMMSKVNLTPPGEYIHHSIMQVHRLIPIE